ncbi:MAG: alanine racemase, partial [Anaerolineae bacterium]
MHYSTWVEVDLSAIRHNVRRTREMAGCEVMAVVKANAYGHGAIPVAQAALQSGATWLAVARLDEGLALRQAGITTPILLLGYIPPQRVEHALEENISLTVWRADHLEHIAAIAKRSGHTARLHLKVDTGMNRLGAPPEEA